MNTPASNTYNRFTRLLATIDYKDWIFAVCPDGINRLYLQVSFTTHDPTTSKAENWSGRKWFLSPHMTDSEVIQTAFKAVLTAEEHEARESFLYQGRAVFGPHISVNTLWASLGPDTDNLDIRKGHAE